MKLKNYFVLQLEYSYSDGNNSDTLITFTIDTMEEANRFICGFIKEIRKNEELDRIRGRRSDLIDKLKELKQIKEELKELGVLEETKEGILSARYKLEGELDRIEDLEYREVIEIIRDISFNY